MNDQEICGIETIQSKADKVVELKRLLTAAAEQTRQIEGFTDLRLFQNQEQPTEFIFTFVVSEPAALTRLQEAEWHDELIAQLPPLIADTPKRTIGAGLG